MASPETSEALARVKAYVEAQESTAEVGADWALADDAELDAAFNYAEEWTDSAPRAHRYPLTLGDLRALIAATEETIHV